MNVYVPGQRFVRVVKTRLTVKDMLEVEVPVFANMYDEASYKSRGYQSYANYSRPQLSFSVVTDIEGRVVLYVDSRDKDGITPSAFSPLDLISVAKLVLLGVSAAAGALTVRTLIRRRAAKALAQSAKTNWEQAPAPRLPKWQPRKPRRCQARFRCRPAKSPWRT
jgi:hypothetical protein